ncbi:biopolymer transporter ExbD [bacterium]|nr:biopolymer transporter ExbD [FCB group bacterium]MBL7191803.1 biopolymer transporter ExbD [bacterium]
MAFVPSKAKKHGIKREPTPNLTSMMDMMTIILLFLLKSMAVSGALLHAVEGINLPNSNSETEPQKHLSFVINEEGVFYEVEGRVVRLLAASFELQNDSLIMFENLNDFLDSTRAMDMELGRETRSKVTLQADKAIPYKYIYKFITTCGESGFTTIQFIVAKEGKEV